ncbi:hypothetical protein HW555_014009 [Spodoptera exigua]|uniref:Uncharacterized protein n=1 Tax=Spodoptera exigua TaxID=7107 RepID=A0A835G324_SPOEX|nr:hypothetical protein HW555_014009 [Spodoptera exigua]
MPIKSAQKYGIKPTTLQSRLTNLHKRTAAESPGNNTSQASLDDDHNYHLPILPKSVIDEATVQGHCSRDPEPIETELIMALMAPSSDQILQTPGVANTKAKNVLTSSCFVKKMKKQALSVKNKSFNDRLAGAKTLSQDNGTIEVSGQRLSVIFDLSANVDIC